MTNMEAMGVKAKKAARLLATAAAQKDAALKNIACDLIENTDNKIKITNKTSRVCNIKSTFKSIFKKTK